MSHRGVIENEVMVAFMCYVEQKSLPGFQNSIISMQHTLDEGSGLISTDLSKYVTAMRDLLCHRVHREIKSCVERHIDTVCNNTMMVAVAVQCDASTSTKDSGAAVIRALKSLITVEDEARQRCHFSDFVSDGKIATRITGIMLMLVMTTSFKNTAQRVEAQNLIMGRAYSHGAGAVSTLGSANIECEYEYESDATSVQVEMSSQSSELIAARKCTLIGLAEACASPAPPPAATASKGGRKRKVAEQSSSKSSSSDDTVALTSGSDSMASSTSVRKTTRRRTPVA